MQISQGHLNTLEHCPRLFQYIYLDQFSMPLTVEQQEALARGSRFHTLMQQRELGLSTTVVGEDAALSDLVERFLAAAPEVMRSVSTTPTLENSVVFRQSEHRRQMRLREYAITVVYDLLILEAEQAEIFDWKTGLGIPSSERLERNWQFKLYPFVLAETSLYKPEQITMTYWFVQPEGPTAPANPHKIAFPYSQSKHQTIQQELDRLLTQLSIYLKEYREGRSLPQINDIDGLCKGCPFTSRCHRNDYSIASDTSLFNLVDIHEVSI